MHKTSKPLNLRRSRIVRLAIPCERGPRSGITARIGRGYAARESSIPSDCIAALLRLILNPR